VKYTGFLDHCDAGVQPQGGGEKAGKIPVPLQDAKIHLLQMMQLARR
jgi:hypothetical protein